MAKLKINEAGNTLQMETLQVTWPQLKMCNSPMERVVGNNSVYHKEHSSKDQGQI